MSDAALEVGRWGFSFITSVGAAALFGWLFKESLGKALERDLLRDVEAFKSRLSIESQSQVERLKAELQKEFLRAQLTTNKTHDVYSLLIQKLRKAEGPINSLWGARLAPSLDRYDTEDLLGILEEAKAPGQDKEEVRALLPLDRDAAIRKVEAVLRQKEKNDARKAHDDARNYVVLEGIFMSKPVRELAMQVLKTLWDAWATVHVGDVSPESGVPRLQHFQAAMELAHAQLAQLEDLMRADLMPSRPGDR